MCHASTTSSNCHLMMRGKSWMALKINARENMLTFAQKKPSDDGSCKRATQNFLIFFHYAFEDEHGKGRIKEISSLLFLFCA